MPPRKSLAEPRGTATRHVGCVAYPLMFATVAAAVVVVQNKVCPRVMYERTRLWPYSARHFGPAPTALASSHCPALHHPASKVVRTNNNADQGGSNNEALAARSHPARQAASPIHASSVWSSHE